MSNLWMACPSSDLCIASFEEASFYYYRPTGETHLLNAFPREIFQLTSNQPLTLETIAERLASLCEEKNTPSWQKKITDVLNNLETLGLVIEAHL